VALAIDAVRTCADGIGRIEQRVTRHYRTVHLGASTADSILLGAMADRQEQQRPFFAERPLL